MVNSELSMINARLNSGGGGKLPVHYLFPLDGFNQVSSKYEFSILYMHITFYILENFPFCVHKY